MKNLKKLSLEDEINREAEEIEKKVKENKEIEGMTVSEDMETALFNKIQEYEYDKRLKKVVYRKKKKNFISNEQSGNGWMYLRNIIRCS